MTNILCRVIGHHFQVTWTVPTTTEVAVTAFCRRCGTACRSVTVTKQGSKTKK